MSNTLTIITNNVPRFTVDSWELTADERKEFNYLDWNAIEAGTDSATFFRFKGDLYDLGEFSSSWGLASGMPEHFKGWHGYITDSYFSGMLVKFPEPESVESVIVARFTC